MPGFHKPEPNETHAYHKDSNNDEYYGWAAKGTLTSEAKWQICQLDYTGNNWVEKYPNGSDLPIFEWDEVENYTYYLLGTYYAHGKDVVA